MKNLKTLLIFLILLGCEQKQTVQPDKYDSTEIRSLITKAINHDAVSNNRLAELVDYSSEENSYNTIIVDSLFLSGNVFYSVLLENSNPLLNRFAVYNPSLDPIMIDKSLNGNLFYDHLKTGSKNFIRVNESYISMDTLLLNRLSLYSIDSSGAVLAFRTHTKLSLPEIEFFQDITEFSDSLIKTKINSSKRSPARGKEDMFIFNTSVKAYISSENIFDELIKEEIKSFRHSPAKKQIDTLTAY